MTDTCGTCRFRGESYKKCNEDTGLDDVDSGYFRCDRVKFLSASYKTKAGESAFVIDGSGFFAALCVESDFGCNQWETK